MWTNVQERVQLKETQQHSETSIGRKKNEDSD